MLALIPAFNSREVSLIDVYWADSIGRRNTSMTEVCDGTAAGLGNEGDWAGRDALAGASADSP
jgi:hypothetical protein